MINLLAGDAGFWSQADERYQLSHLGGRVLDIAQAEFNLHRLRYKKKEANDER